MIESTRPEAALKPQPFDDTRHPDFLALSETERSEFLDAYGRAVEYAALRGLFTHAFGLIEGVEGRVGFRRLRSEIIPNVLRMLAEEVMEE